MRGAGITRFLTQKLSWNRFNQPPYHTFRWQGIDGSEVLTHFPPLDTYNSSATVAEVRRSARQYKDHDRSARSFLLFGWGDGGGGPTPQMLETLTQLEDLAGLVLDTIKRAEDGDGLVLRLYEAHGGRGTARVRLDLPWTDASRCNLLEDDGAELAVEGRELVVPYNPFEIVSVRVR